MRAQSVVPDFISTNGNVRAVAASGNSVYIGGSFTEVSFASGAGALIDTATGETDRTFPKFDDRILAIEQDGNGGWYVGGLFKHVQGYPIRYLAHILSDRSVDTAFNAAVNGNVNTISRLGTVLYFGGVFTSVKGQTRNYAASIDLVTSSLTIWNPAPNNAVTAMYATSSGILLGGYFTVAGGQNHRIIASVNTVNGTALHRFLGQTGGVDGIAHIKKFVMAGGVIYFCGNFSKIDNMDRNGLASCDSLTNSVSGWNPGASFTGMGVYDLYSTEDRLYLSGEFTQIAGVARTNLAAISLTTHAVLPFDPAPNADTRGMVMVGNRLAVGGAFTTIGGAAHKNIALLDTTTGQAANWDPKVNDMVYTLSFVNGKLFAGGAFTSINAEPRSRLAAIDVTTGKPRAWAPAVNNTVNALAICPKGLIVGGTFTKIGSSTQGYLSVVDTATGIPLPFIAPVNSTVNTLHVMKTRIYAGGAFTNANGNFCNGFAAFDAATGQVKPWNPSMDQGGALSITSSGSTVYISGYFNTITGRSQKYVAAFDTVTDQILPWDPKVNNLVWSMCRSGAGIVLGGDFTSVRGVVRQRAAIVDPDSGKPAPFIANADMTVNAVASSGATLFLGGLFTKINGVNRQSLASVSLPNGAVLPWDPVFAGQIVYGITLAKQRVYVGGNQFLIGSMPQRYVAALSVPGLTNTIPAISKLSARNLDFGMVRIGNQFTLPLVITNIGEDTMHIESIQFNNSRFSLAAGTAAVPPSASVVDSVRFTPLSTDTLSGSLLVVSDALTSPDSVSLSGYGINEVRPPFPVELVDFTATRTAHGTLLQWNTATEVNNQGFAVERLSLKKDRNGVDRPGEWVTLCFVSGHGTTNAPQHYSFVDQAVTGKVRYRLKQVDRDGAFTFSSEVEAAGNTPQTFSLHQNYPNPFNPSTTVEFTLSRKGWVTLSVYDLTGRLVKILVDEELDEGVTHIRTFRGEMLASGMYIVRLSSGGNVMSRTMTLLK